MVLKTAQIPRDISIQKMLDYIDYVHSLGQEKIPNPKPGTQHNARYTAKVFGFLDARGRLTASGNALVELPDIDSKKSRMAIAYENTDCIKAWIEWSQVDDVFKLRENTAGQFLHSNCSLSKKNKLNRAKVLKKFLRKLKHYHPLNPQKKLLEISPKAKKQIREISVFDPGKASKIIRDLSLGSVFIRVATGYFTPEGYEKLATNLKESKINLMIGTRDKLATETLRNPIEAYIKSIEKGLPSKAKRNTFRKLHLELLKGTSRVRMLRAKHSRRLHGKSYLFDNSAAYVTSSNLTLGGLSTNIETGHVITRTENINHLIERFDYYFDLAEDILTEILEPLEDGMIPPVKPGLLYLRVLLELYEDIPDLSDITDYKLANYQKMVVGNTLAKMDSLKGVLIVSPPGTGKTIMGAYIAASLFPQRVRRILVFPPNKSIGKEWDSVFTNFGISAKIITHGKMRQGKEEDIKEIIESIRPDDLIIIDECHSFRTENRKGIKTLKEILRINSTKQPYRMLLTATPFGKGVENINTLVNLTDSKRDISELIEIKDHPNMVHVTLPFIMNKFGEKKQGDNVGIMFPTLGQLYFANKITRTVQYSSALTEDLLNIVKVLDLRKRQRWRDKNQTSIIEDSEEFKPGPPIPFLEIHYARSAESSPMALKTTLNNALEDIEEGNTVYYDGEEVVTKMRLMLDLLTDDFTDTKLEKLVEIINNSDKSEKILIFAQYIETVKYISRELTKVFTDRKVDYITGEFSPNQREDKLIRFAPVAHKKRNVRRRDDIDILIANDCIKEGQNLQDATILVNYDLYWTPLVLIQRVGRLDRPTKQKRTFRTFNFYPGSIVYDSLVDMWSKLEGRQRIYEDFASTKVVGDFDRDLNKSIDERDLKFITDIYDEKDYNQVLEKYIPTSQHLVDLANAKKSDKVAARRVQYGMRSAMKKKKSGIYVLFKYKGKKYSIWKGDSSDEIEFAPSPIPPEAFLPSIRATMNEPLGIISENFEDDVGKLLQYWADENGSDSTEIKLVCSEYVHP